jgi:cation transporter-like permease
MKKYEFILIAFLYLKKGITSNLASIQTSRMSTHLHQTVPRGKLPKDRSACVQPFAVFFGNGEQIY